MNVKRLAELVAVLACVLWGFLGFFIRELQAAGLTSVQIAGLRLLFTSVLLLIAALATDPKALKIAKRDILHVVFFGFVIVIYGVVFNEAVGILPLSIATILEMTSPLFVIAFSFVLFREIPTKMKIASFFLVFIGGGLVTGLDGALNGHLSPLGIAFGLLAGVFLGLSSIGIKYISDRGYSLIPTLFWIFFTAALFTIPFSQPIEASRIMFGHWEPLALVLGLVFLMTVLPFGMQAWSITKVSVSTVSILSVSQCVFAGVFGYFYYHEELTLLNYLGILIVVAAIVLLEISNVRNRDRDDGLTINMKK